MACKLFAAALPALIAASPTDLYVNCGTGSNNNNGFSPATAWRSLQFAAAQLQSMQPLSADVTVHVAPGECFPCNEDGSLNFSLPVLALGASDSGSAAATITYQADVAGSVSLYGGAKLDPAGWALVDATLNLYAYNVTALARWGFGGYGAGGLGQCTNNNAELFFNSTPMVQARYPNIAANGSWQWINIENVTSPSASFITASARPLRWVNETAAYLHGYWQFGWADNYVAVQSITPSGSGAAITSSSSTPVLYGYTAGAQFYGTNLRSELDAPSEFYFDAAESMLYFIPPAGADIRAADTFVTMSDAVVVVNGAASDGAAAAAAPAPERRTAFFAPSARAGGRAVAPEYEAAFIQVTTGATVSYVTLSGFNVMYARGQGVSVSAAAFVTLSALNVSNHGRSGVSVVGNYCTVADVSVYNVGCSALYVGGGDEAVLTAGGNSLLRSTASHYARVCRTYQPGLGWSGVQNTYDGNVIQYAPHCGALGGGNNNVFTRNTFSDLCTEVSDSGAWYAGRSWVRRGNIVANNTFTRIVNTNPNPLGYQSVQGVYLDDELSGQIVVNNTFVDVFQGLLLGGGRDNWIAGNTFIRPVTYALAFDNRGMNWQNDACAYNVSYNGSLVLDLFAVNYQQPPYAVWYPPIVTTLSDRPCVPVNNSVVNNFYCNATQGFANVNGNATSWDSVVANNVNIC